MKKRTLLTSILGIIMCLSLTVGGTFALFTSKSEVNVAVTSATVDVRAYVSKSEYSFDSRLTEASNCTHVINADGGLDINYMMPGDTVTATVEIENKSDIAIEYKVNTTVSGELADYLVVTPAVKGWTFIENGASIDPQTVVISLPYEEDDANAQGKSASILITVEAVQGNAEVFDTWDGAADTSWYNDTDTEFTLNTAEQVAGLSTLVDGGNDFAGKTVKLGGNIDLYSLDKNGEPICFNPIGSYRNRTDQAFKGTFDGQGKTIKNMSQNTWALNNGYYYEDLGLGLFGYIEDATIKNLVMDGASLSGESAICGVVAATAYGDCTFENIIVKNSNCADYQYYSGGIVGWASGNHQYINCDIDASTTIVAQWGDFDNSTGGVIGGAGDSAKIFLKDCDIACRIDSYNDVTSTYQWYAYRRAGMLIGNTGKTATITKIDEETGKETSTNYASAPQLTCENVTVTYGEWANYTYCEFAGTNWPYVRVQAGVSNSAYSNPRYGHPTDANGNTVVDDNHVHNDGEDHQILCVFDQLYGGGQSVYGTATHPGVTVIYNNK